MENKQSPSKKKLKSIQEEKFIREVDYDSFAESSSHPPKELLLEILQKGSAFNSSKKVLVSIKPRVPVIKTIYIAEKSRFQSKKRSDKSGSRLAIGDHSSYTTRFTENDSNTVNTILWGPNPYINSTQSDIFTGKNSARSLPESSTVQFSKWSNTDASYQNVIYNTKRRSAEKCYIYSQPPLNMTRPNNIKKTQESNTNKVDIGTLFVTNLTNEDIPPHNILNLSRRLEHLEKKIFRQEMVFRSLDPNIPLSSSDEDSKNQIMKDNSKLGNPGCSYVEYSHVPETSAFQRYTQQPAPLSASKATTIQKEHNSEQYGRDFTLYDGITARGRRQCASVPCKRDEGPKMAAERVHKIRHKLNPIRDYRLMDTVHYLAQGEFAPRDDGIKLTPSREAVLSDIIWEDVCRTHWPNTRLARRMTTHSERHGPKSELQRLIDSLLRERIAHVERRRRRHYRIVKLNHRHESCRPLGKTGDIIVASHKSKQNTDERELAVSDHNTINDFTPERRRNERRARRSHRSHDRLVLSESKNKKQYQQDDCSPGTSYAAQNSTGNREATCCYHTSSPDKSRKCFLSEPDPVVATENDDNELTIISSVASKTPRLVVKKKSSRKKSFNKEEPNLEHYILLPTLVIKSPSNMRRQKKFNELYHRILNVQLNKGQSDIEKMNPEIRPHKKDIGFNINVTLSNSEENMEK